MLVQKVNICTEEQVDEFSTAEFGYRHNANFKHKFWVTSYNINHSLTIYLLWLDEGEHGNIEQVDSMQYTVFYRIRRK